MLTVALRTTIVATVVFGVVWAAMVLKLIPLEVMGPG
jgi:predicted secreted protein